MKAWQFKSDRSPKEIGEKLEQELKRIGGFVFNTNHSENSAVTFKIRKRILYAWYLAFQNWTVVKGEVLKNEKTENTNVQVTFNQHPFIKTVLFLHGLMILSFVIGYSLGAEFSYAFYLLAGLVVIVGIVLGYAVKRKFDTDIERYKALMSSIFDIK